MKQIHMRRTNLQNVLWAQIILIAIVLTSASLWAQSDGGQRAMLSGLVSPHDYVQKRASSYDRTGGNADFYKIAAGDTITLLDDAGPGIITHIWVTISSPEQYHLKKLVLRMYWDGEASPSVETPIGDFFGLGLGDYFQFESIPLSVAPDKALNSFFPMPFRKRARITVTNEGREAVDSFYFNIDYQALHKDLAADTMYFHAQYRQATPAKGWTNQWESNDAPVVIAKKNLDGENNYVWMEATGQGHFVGVTMSVLQNQDGWWGEGDDMFFIDGEKRPSINGTGSEDYFPRSLGFWRSSLLLCAIRSSRERCRDCGKPLFRVPVSSGFADSFHQVSPSDDRARTCQSSLRQLFFCRLLVPEGAARRLSHSTPGRAAPSTYLSSGRTRKCCQVIAGLHS